MMLVTRFNKHQGLSMAKGIAAFLEDAQAAEKVLNKEERKKAALTEALPGIKLMLEKGHSAKAIADKLNARLEGLKISVKEIRAAAGLTVPASRGSAKRTAAKTETATKSEASA